MITDPRSLRPLGGVGLGISISESTDTTGLGFSASEVNSAVRQLSTAIIAQGGRVIFGHDWRDGGVMAEVYQLAINYQQTEAEGDEKRPALISNFVAWPRRSKVSPEDQSRFGDILQITETKPAGAPPLGGFEQLDSKTRLILGVKSLTDMRHHIVEASDARICLGGRTEGSSGRCGGIIEEAFLTLQQRKPLFISGLFGGASKQFIQALRGETSDSFESFRARPDVAEALEIAGPDPEVRPIEPLEIGHWGMDRLASCNMLSQEENEKLIDARQLSEVIGWMLVGLGRLKKSSGQPDHASA